MGASRGSSGPHEAAAPKASAKVRQRTRDKCAVSGVYISVCGCQSRVSLTNEMYFPSCVACGKAVWWLLETIGGA